MGIEFHPPETDVFCCLEIRFQGEHDSSAYGKFRMRMDSRVNKVVVPGARNYHWRSLAGLS